VDNWIKVLKMKNIAIIPIREGSTRIPQKNFRDFFGKPMFLYTYEAAKESGLFEDIVISTDSKKVLAICKARGVTVPFVRPDALASDQASLNDVCLHTLEEMKKKGKQYDNFCLLWATAPMRDCQDIRAAFDLLAGNAETEAVTGVTDCYQYYPAHIVDAQGYIQPLVCLENMTTVRTQDVPKTFVDNSSMCWTRCESFFKQKTWMPKKTKGYYMPRHKSVDLDTHEDLEILSFYFAKYKAIPADRSIGGARLPRMKRVFFDTEFTRGGQNTTLVSIGFVSECGRNLYLELSDYESTQVTPWLEKNILSLLEGNKVTTLEARKIIEDWFNQIAPDQKIQLISAGKEMDSILLYNIWGEVAPESTLRSWHDRLPPQICQKTHVDLDTIFLLNGIDPLIDRAAFAEADISGKRHNALYDAQVVKACWDKMLKRGWVE